MQMLHKMTVVCVRVCGECAYIAFCEKFALALIPASIETLGFLVASLSQECSTSTILPGGKSIAAHSIRS